MFGYVCLCSVCVCVCMYVCVDTYIEFISVIGVARNILLDETIVRQLLQKANYSLL